MRNPQRFSVGVSIAALAASVLLGGCGSSAEPLGPGCTAAPNPAPTPTGPPGAFKLAGIADIYTVGTEGGYFMITAQGDGPIDELQTKLREMVENAGFDISGTEGEEDDAEVFFAVGDTAAGQVRMHNAACAGKVDIEISLLDNPSAVPTK